MNGIFLDMFQKILNLQNLNGKKPRKRKIILRKKIKKETKKNEEKEEEKDIKVFLGFNLK